MSLARGEIFNLERRVRLP